MVQADNVQKVTWIRPILGSSAGGGRVPEQASRVDADCDWLWGDFRENHRKMPQLTRRASEEISPNAPRLAGASGWCVSVALYSVKVCPLVAVLRLIMSKQAI